MSWAHGQDGQCDSNDHDDHWDPIDQYLSTIIIITVIRMKIVSLTYDYFNQSIIINYNKWDPDDYSLYCYHFVSWVHNHDNHCFSVTWLRLPTAWSIIHFIIMLSYMIIILILIIMMKNGHDDQNDHDNQYDHVDHCDTDDFLLYWWSFCVLVTWLWLSLWSWWS